MNDEQRSLNALIKRNIRVSLEHYLHFFPNADEEAVLRLWNDGREVETEALAREVLEEIKQEILLKKIKIREMGGDA